ncbi:amine-terminal domain cyclin (macronuclear) [Tetrahymena thermophila SB210]|uniref:Amine-terminal domain cyclin n=1 Tax=Tetrahymena thermophila (strain SB210) TaxID=312017 RepID=I7M2Y7_TETTS|nr:amine-terminal domain cyclin [Tetrahymena thermophila SB210]EAS01638.2 amine-terminal domain cyclin [Tetrahymena thermophila SB210]|eukprot:XP_001021883.2 amine-terminal domain cyclin [Tetrahymena thermophila SB210]
MSKLLSFFLVENKQSNIVFKQNISSKTTNPAVPIQKQNNQSSAAIIQSANINIHNNKNKKVQKSECKRQLKITQLMQNTKQSQPTQPFQQINKCGQKIINNKPKEQQQQQKLKQNSIIIQTSQQQKTDQTIYNSPPYCMLTQEEKGGQLNNLQQYVEKQQVKQLNHKPAQIDQFSSSSLQNQETETQITNDSPCSPPYQISSSNNQNLKLKKTKLRSFEKEEDILVSEFEINFCKKKCQESSQQIFEASPEFTQEGGQQQIFEFRKKQISFLSQNTCDNDESYFTSFNDNFQAAQDLFTCTETLSPNCFAMNESPQSDSETQKLQLSQQNNKLSLKNRLKIIDSTSKQSHKNELDDFEKNITIQSAEKELNYQQEYIDNLMKLEKDYYFECSIFENKNCQIDRKMRYIVINWIFELCSDYNLNRQTCQTAINIFDRYISKKISSINKQNIQLIAATCVYISSKKEEQVSPKLKHFIESTKNVFTVNQFLNQELDILNILNFKINGVCFEEWLQNICQYWDEFINQVQNSQYHQKIYFNNKTEESKLRYSQLQKVIDLIQLDEESNNYNKSNIVLALIYLVYGIYSQDFLLNDVVTYFSSINMYYHRDYFQQYNKLMLSFKQFIFINNAHFSTALNEESFIQAIQYVSKFFGYFQKPQQSQKVIENNTECIQKQFIIENGLEFILDMKNQQQTKSS